MNNQINNQMNLVYCDGKNNVYDHPHFLAAFRQGRSFCKASDVSKEDLIPLPFGSFLFSLPDRNPIYYSSSCSNSQKENVEGNSKNNKFKILKNTWAASAFVSSGYLRTHLPAFHKNKNAPILSLWGYSGVVFDPLENVFKVPAIRIDSDPRSDPQIHQNDPELNLKIKEIKKLYPKNRLVQQLAYCSTEYRCLCARNFFLGRYEAPIPTTPSCNSGCLGCLSEQKNSPIKASQNRISFPPTSQEIAEVITHHFQNKKNLAPIASFGQGCEGEPLMRAKDLAESIKLIRKKTERGTINLNTNGSLPNMVKLMIESGLNSIRVSLNSLSEKYYNPYYRPKNYTFSDVIKSIEIALNAGINVSLNLFFFPGFTDSEEEVTSLMNFLEAFPISMIQTRNLNIDPDYYLDRINFNDSNAIGIKNLVTLLRRDFPKVELGYYNRFLS
ncbi:MAG: radical SAM protein [Oligoflexia bacterium]|nr:radical SAM protein [Oligoflexia bacterium]